MINDAPDDIPPTAPAPLAHRSRAANRRQCPTCGARRSEHQQTPAGGSLAICHRCQCDLSPLLHLERQADTLHDRARWCYARGWYRRAAELADRAVSIEASPDNVRLAACAHLLSGGFTDAWRAWLRMTRL